MEDSKQFPSNEVISKKTGLSVEIVKSYLGGVGIGNSFERFLIFEDEIYNQIYLDAMKGSVQDKKLFLNLCENAKSEKMRISPFREHRKY